MILGACPGAFDFHRFEKKLLIAVTVGELVGINTIAVQVRACNLGLLVFHYLFFTLINMDLIIKQQS